MNKIQADRARLKVLREEKKVLVAEIRAKKSRKKEIETEMALLRAGIKLEKGKKDEAPVGQADQTSAQKTD